jgi:(E)-4-hydroxy-3-methyl-but-2-enyl pyrophosphate reductase
MKVILAQTAGFCKGVRRAMAQVLEQSDQADGPIFTDGPLIHNPQTIEVLKQRGVKAISEQDSPGQGDIVFIRTHGVSPSRREEIRNMGGKVCDATCPDVARIQGLIRRHRNAGDMVVIVGDRNHAEVIGLAGYAGDSGHVLKLAEEVAALPEAPKVCVVAQSTLTHEVYRDVTTALKQRYDNVEVLDTICPSTYRRQEEIRELASVADAVVVVGGKNSANTRHLAQISQGVGKPTFHVETAEELTESELGKFRTVAVTAGASTPNWILTEVVEHLREIEPESVNFIWRLIRSSFRFMVRSNLFVALGSAMLCYANARLMGISLGWLPYAISFCYILSVHLISRVTDIADFARDDSGTLSRQAKRGRLMLKLAIAGAAGALILAGSQGAAPLGIMTLLIGLGMIYRIDFPGKLLPLGLKRLSLRLIPASKDLFMALGWSVVTVIFPLYIKQMPLLTPAFFLAFTSTFLLVTVRSLLFDVRDIQGDLIVGRETLPTLIGTGRSKVLLYSLTTLQALVIALGAWTGWLSGFGWVMLAVSAYIYGYLQLFDRGILQGELPVEVTGDTQFILAGTLALLLS